MRPVKTFIAIELANDTRTMIGKAIALLKKTRGGDKVRWIRPENLHATVRFLGNIQPTQLLTLSPHLNKSLRGIPPFRMEFGQVCPFPDPRKPHVIAVDILFSDALRNLFNAVEQGVIEAGFPPESRQARPHLTIGRLRGPKAPEFNLNLTSMHIGFTVKDIVIYKSEHQRQGVRYIELERIPLG